VPVGKECNFQIIFNFPFGFVWEELIRMVKIRKTNNRKRAHLDFSWILSLFFALTVKMERPLAVLPRSRFLFF